VGSNVVFGVRSERLLRAIGAMKTLVEPFFRFLSGFMPWRGC
jgi:hypothetical protein